MKTKLSNQSIGNAVEAEIIEMLSGFTKPQSTQTIYFELLRELQGSFCWLDRWQLRIALLIAISESGLCEDESEIRELYSEAQANMDVERKKNVKYLRVNN